MAKFDGNRKRLSPEEARRGRAWRWAALVLTGLLTVLAWASLPFFVYLWWATVLAGWRTFILREPGPSIPSLVTAGDWFQLAVRLDLTSCGAFICVLVVFFSAIRGAAHLVRAWRERAEFSGHAYALHWVPAILPNLCVQLGLIGALLSFVIASFSNLDAGSSPAQIFLLLCASLASSLIGAVAAYLLIPAAEAVLAVALGRHQVSAGDDPRGGLLDLAAALKTFTSEMLHAQQQVRVFRDLLAGGEQLVAALREAQAIVAALGQQLAVLTRTLKDNAAALAQVVFRLERAGGAIEAGAVALDKASGALGQLPGKFEEPLANFKTNLDTLGNLAKSTAQAQVELAGVAAALKGPLARLAEIVQVLPWLLQVLRRGHVDQGQRLGEVVGSFQKIEQQLGKVATDLGKLVTETKAQPGLVRGEVERLLSDLRTQERQGEAQALADLTTALKLVQEEMKALAAEQRKQRELLTVVVRTADGFRGEADRLRRQLRSGSRVTLVQRVRDWWSPPNGNHKPRPGERGNGAGQHPSRED